MKNQIIAMFALLLAASTLDAQLPGEVTDLGLGRSRLQYLLKDRESTPLPDLKHVGELSFFESWLMKELPKSFPKLDTIDVLERVSVRTNLQGKSTARERLVEITGPKIVVNRARKLIFDLDKASELQFRTRLWVVIKTLAKLRPAAPKVEMLSQKAIELRKVELARDENSFIMETPVLITFNYRNGSIQVGRVHSYLKDFELFSAYKTMAFEPVIGEIRSGLDWQVGLVKKPKGDRIFMACGIQYRSLRQPFDRLTGRVGILGDKLQIERPVFHDVKWESKNIVIKKGEAGFRVTGIPFWRVDTVNWRSTPPRELEILCSVNELSLKKQQRRGIVQGFDNEARMAFLKLDEGKSLKKGQALSFYRADQEVGKGRVLEQQGHLMTIQVEHGEIRAGDEVR